MVKQGWAIWLDGRAGQNGMFWHILEHFHPRDPPWLSNIYEARLTNDINSLFKDGIKISKSEYSK